MQELLNHMKGRIDMLTIDIIPHFKDDRGSFTVLHNLNTSEHTYVQDNFSVSNKNVIRGLHIQTKNPQGKLVSCVSGRILDIALDLRKDSDEYGKAYTFELYGNRQLYIPEGFAHGFLSKEDNTCVFYKCTTEYDSKSEVIINPFDESLSIDWGVNIDDCILSDKDKNGISLKDYLT